MIDRLALITMAAIIVLMTYHALSVYYGVFG
jgi:hypothetical protein